MLYAPHSQVLSSMEPVRNSQHHMFALNVNMIPLYQPVTFSTIWRRCNIFLCRTVSGIWYTFLNFLLIVFQNDLRQFGKEKGLCPYFLARKAVNRASIVVYSYHYIFDPKIAEIVSKDFSSKFVSPQPLTFSGLVWFSMRHITLIMFALNLCLLELIKNKWKERLPNL